MNEPIPGSTAPVGPGTTLAGRYVLGSILGRGGAADVYRAEDRVLAREVAVKVLRESTESATDRARFVAEARTVANLAHHGLVTMLDAGISDDQAEQPFLVMELVDGRTLSALIAAGPCDPAETARIAMQLAEAIAYAHERDVVHRDVKPGNVLLNSTGAVKLADFGIARLIGDTVRHTQTGHAIGTAAYLAPEQVLGDPLTTAVDIYALGLVLLEMFTRERAFPGLPTEAALARLSRQPEIPSDVPPAWRTLLGDMTARDPAERPDARQLTTRLRHLTGSGSAPSHAQPATKTAVLTDLVATPAPAGGAVAPAASLVDDLGDRLADRVTATVNRFVERSRTLEREHVVLGLVALVFLLLIVAAAAAGGASGDARVPDAPQDVPARLQGPLQQLHNAVAEASG